MAHTSQSLSEDLTHEENQLLTEYLQNPSRFKASQNPTYLEFFNNPRCMLAAMRIHKRAIYYASDRLKDDAEFMLAAMRIDKEAIDYALDRLKDDAVFMLAAMRIDPRAINDASDRLKDDAEFMLAAMKINPNAILYASRDLKNNKEFMLAAMKINPNAILYASRDLKNNKEFILAAMRIDPSVFAYASQKLKSDEDFMRQAIVIDPKCIQYALPPLFKKEDFYIKAMIQTPQVAYYVYERASILAAIKSNPVVMAHLNEYILKDEEFIKQALHSNLEAIQHLHLGIKFRHSIFWNIQRSNLTSPEINRYKTQFLMLESLKALASIAIASAGVLLVASVISSPFALALGLPLIGLSVLCLGWMTKSHLEARHQSQMYARSESVKR